jgi:hypothetical protein
MNCDLPAPFTNETGVGERAAPCPCRRCSRPEVPPWPAYPEAERGPLSLTSEFFLLSGRRLAAHTIVACGIRDRHLARRLPDAAVVWRHCRS